jgi:ribonuclease HII
MKKEPKSQFIVGIDEAGRGPLAGPVSVGTILMTKHAYATFLSLDKNKGLHNSKKLNENARDEWYKKIKEWQKRGMLDFAYASVSAKLIDEKGISPAIKKCISQNLRNLEVPFDAEILMDGSLKAPIKYKNQKTIIGGDESEPIISLASIVAKVRRDKVMQNLDKKYPKYHFDSHKGYGTERHRKAIAKYGLSEVHRRSFCGK